MIRDVSSGTAYFLFARFVLGRSTQFADVLVHRLGMFAVYGFRRFRNMFAKCTESRAELSNASGPKHKRRDGSDDAKADVLCGFNCFPDLTEKCADPRLTGRA